VNRSIRLGIGILISAVAVWLSMRDVRIGEVLDALSRANYVGFVVVMALTVFGFWIRAFRWRWLIATPKPLPLDSLFSATMIGFMANNLLPLRLGEFVRAWALGRRENISKTTVFATVVVERVVDMITLLAMLGFVVILHPLSNQSEAGRMVQAGATVLVIASAFLLISLVVIEHNPALMKRLVVWIAGLMPEKVRPKMQATLGHFLEGLALFRSVGTLLWVLLLSFVMFGMYALALHVSIWALGIQAPWYAGLTMLVITAIGIMVPAAPGYIGTLNLACVAGLALFSVGKDQSVPFSWFYWASQWLPISVVGLYYLRREGLSLRSIGRMGEETA
jgi:glycosyltransferase 2 family protein